MTETNKYKRRHEFKSQRESLAFTPKDAGADTLARARERNTQTFLENYQRQGDADLVSMDLAFKQQKVIDEHNDRVAKLSAEWHAEDLHAFSGLLQYGIGHMAQRQAKRDTEKAQKDFLKLMRNPEIKKKILPLYINNVRLNDKNIRDMTALGFAKNLEGENLAFVKRILNDGGFYHQTMRRLMKADVIEQLPIQIQQNLSEKVIIPDDVFPGITEAISIEDISPEGEHKDQQGNIQPHGKYYKLLYDPTSGRDHDGSVQAYLYAKAQEKVELVLGKWYGMEAVIADFQPVMTAYFGDRSISDASTNRAFFNSKIQKEIRAVTIKEVKTLKPSEAVYELIQDVNAQQIYMGGHGAAFQTKLNQLLVAWENGEITLSKLRAFEKALVDSNDHDNIGFTGTKEFREWRKNDFAAVNWDKRIDDRIKAAGVEAKAKRDNAIISLKGQIYQYKIANGQPPPLELISDWAITLDSNGESGGLSVEHMVTEATKNMSTQQGDTIANMQKDLTAIFAATGPINPEVAANYPTEIRDWLEEKEMLGDSTWVITDSMKGDMEQSIKAISDHVLNVEGDYDKILSRDMIKNNGERWIIKRYKELRKSGVPEWDAMYGDKGALKEFEAIVKENPEAWTVRKSTQNRTKEITTSALNEWETNGFSFDTPLVALEERISSIFTHLQSGGRIHKELTYKGKDGNYYKIFDDTLEQLAARSGKTKMQIIKEQLEGMGMTVNLAGEFQYLNADRKTQYIMESGGSGLIRAEVNSSVKDSHLEKKGITDNGSKYYGIPISRLNDSYLEDITGVNAEYLRLVEPDGFKAIINKLGIKSHEQLTPKHVKLIQKRILSEHGGLPFGLVDDKEFSGSSSIYNGSPENITPGLKISFGNDPNRMIPELEGKTITYASPKDKFTAIGTTRKVGFLNKTQVYGVLSGSDTRVHLGWRSPESQKNWVLELMKSQNPYLNKELGGSS